MTDERRKKLFKTLATILMNEGATSKDALIICMALTHGALRVAMAGDVADLAEREADVTLFLTKYNLAPFPEGSTAS